MNSNPNPNEEEWRVNMQKTNDYRQQILNLMIQKCPNNQRILQEVENRAFNETQTKQDYNFRIQHYFKNVQQQQKQQQQQQHQQQQQQQQQQVQQNQQVIGMQSQQVHHYQQVGLQQQTPQSTVILGGNQNVPKNVVNISGMSIQQQQQLKMQQQAIRPSSQFVQQPNILQQQQQQQHSNPNYILQPHHTPTSIQGQNVIITNLNQPPQSQIRAQVPQQHSFVNGQSGSQPGPGTSDEEELYNRKIQELKANHLARLERMLQNSSRNSQEIHKLKAFMEVIMGHRRVPMDVLLKCEASLNAQRQPASQQQQPQPQPAPQTQQNPIVQQQQPPIFQKNAQPINPAQLKAQDSPSSLPPQVKLVSEQTTRVTTPSQPIHQPIKVQPEDMFKKLKESIEACNASDPAHKSNVRYLLDSIKNSIDGPEEKKLKIENEFEKEKKKLVNLRECESSKIVQNEQIPEKLLLELANLPKEKFRIEAKSRDNCVILPIQNESVENIKMETSDLNDSDQENVPNKSSMENYYVTLNCKIVNKNLPLVPPIKIYVPYEYPLQNPFVDCVQISNQEDDILPNYQQNGIFKRINKHFQRNYLRLSDRYSVSQLLDAWYMSVESLQII